MTFKPLHLCSLLALSITLGACDDLARRHIGAVEDWNTIGHDPRPRVDHVRHVHQVMFDTDAERLLPTEAERLDAFIAGAGLARGDGLMVVRGAESLAEKRFDVVTSYLRFKGLVPEAARAAPGVDRPLANRVTLVVERDVVTLPPCPNWTRDPGTNFQNTTSSNYGCATATNLGLMVANPADLNRGTTTGPRDGEYAGLAIEAYRKGETKSLNPENLGALEKQQKDTGQNELFKVVTGGN